MDIAAATVFARKVMDSKKDKFTEAGGVIHNATIGSILFGVAIGALAVYLSWTCNTAAGVDTVGKVIYAVFAYIFGFIYLIFYALFRAGRCAAA